MRQGRGKRWFYFLVVVGMFGVFSSEVKAAEPEAGGMTVDFHGYVESNMIIRDQNGFQNGFMNHLDAVQQRNTLKFDIVVYPKLNWETLSIKKIQLTYRGAYDSIFDLRQGAYGDIDNDGGPSRFDYGKRDIRFENDLREAFVDATYDGPLGVAFFRPGRQIISWGEAFGLTILDTICPPDNSYAMFFQNPDDVKIPLWMGRLNYSIPPQKGFGLNFDLLFIPDIRPQQLAPRDKSMEAPYAFLFSGLSAFKNREDVPTDKREYGAKMTAEIGERLSVSLVYFRDVVNNPAIKLTNFVFIPGVGPVPTTALYTHGMQHVYGAYFAYTFVPLDIVIRGEFGRQTAFPTKLKTPDFSLGYPLLPFGPPAELRTYRLKPVTQWMIGIDKNVWWFKFLFPHDPTSLGVQWLHKKINQFEPANSEAKDTDLFTLQASSYWWSAKLNPSIFVIYNPEGGVHAKGGGTWMFSPKITYAPTGHWYATLAMQFFMGDKDVRSDFASLIVSFR